MHLPVASPRTRVFSSTSPLHAVQAVLTANVEEAEYSALVTADGKMLVQSRFAVRNNQRNFLKLTSARERRTLERVGGRAGPIRPGRAPDGASIAAVGEDPIG